MNECSAPLPDNSDSKQADDDHSDDQDLTQGVDNPAMINNENDNEEFQPVNDIRKWKNQWYGHDEKLTALFDEECTVNTLKLNLAIMMDKDLNPWYCADEVRRGYGYKQHTNPWLKYANVPEDCKMRFRDFEAHPEGHYKLRPDAWIINEKGLNKLKTYAAKFSSRIQEPGKRDELEHLDDIICGDILPNLRKHGHFSVSKNKMKEIQESKKSSPSKLEKADKTIEYAVANALTAYAEEECSLSDWDIEDEDAEPMIVLWTLFQPYLRTHLAKTKSFKFRKDGPERKKLDEMQQKSKTLEVIWRNNANSKKKQSKK